MAWRAALALGTALGLAMALLVGAVDLGGRCETPEGQPGAYRLFPRDCAALVDLLTGPTAREQDLVRNSSAPAWHGDVPIVCCPERPTPRLARFFSEDTLDSCGIQVSSTILGGRELQDGEMPWAVLLLNDSKRVPYCGGVLISEALVLTAAHCVWPQRPENVTLVLGANNLTKDAGNPANIVRFNMADVILIVHPQYDERSHLNDIALIRLGRRLSIAFTIQPVCLPDPNSEDVSTGTSLRVVGWGVTENGTTSDVKRAADVSAVDFEACRSAFGRPVDGTRQVCAGGGQGVDSCLGDSGGPLVVAREVPDARARRHGRWHLVGLVSWGAKDCAQPDTPAVYTKVQHFVPWILQAIEDLGEPPSFRP